MMRPEKKSPDLLYIMGPSFSGSTLLTNILAMHPRIATVGELKASAIGDIETYTCSCGTLLQKCEFWRQVREEMTSRGVGFPFENLGLHFRDDDFICDRLLSSGFKGSFFEKLRKLCLGLYRGCRNKYSAILERNRIAIEVIKQIQGGDIFLDGSKDPNRLYFFLKSGYWRIKILYLIRDGRGSTNSSIRHHNDAMAKTAMEWVQMHKECDRLATKYHRDCLTIRYEDFCLDPDAHLSRIYTFIGLDSASVCTDFLSVPQHILGNSMRLSSTSEIRLDEKWKKSLTPEDLAVFDQIAGKLNRSYGYE